MRSTHCEYCLIGVNPFLCPVFSEVLQYFYHSNPFHMFRQDVGRGDTSVSKGTGS